MTTLRTVFGAALSLHHIQRARLRQRPTRRRVLRPRRTGVLGGGALIARGEDIGVLGALTFSCSSCTDGAPYPLGDRRHFDVAHPQVGERIEDGVDHRSNRGLLYRPRRVSTASTPGDASAPALSIDRLRAWAWGERTITVCANPDRCRSSAKLPRPVRRRKSSLRRTG